MMNEMKYLNQSGQGCTKKKKNTCLATDSLLLEDIWFHGWTTMQDSRRCNSV